MFKQKLLFIKLVLGCFLLTSAVLSLPVNSQTQGRPNVPGIEQLAMAAVRYPEFAGHSDTSTAGDADSCGPYQQRVSEFLIPSTVNNYAKNLLGKEFEEIFTPQIQKFILSNKDKIREEIKILNEYQKTENGLTDNLGIDIAMNQETPVITPADGQVKKIINSPENGKMMIITHPSLKLRTIYAHLSDFKVKEGEEIKEGQIIAYSGKSGNLTTGTHLHFQITQNMEGNWDQQTIDPKSKPELFKKVLTPFTGICKELAKAQVTESFFDKLFINRVFAYQPELRNFKVTSDNVKEFASRLCAIQRPADCKLWEEKALKALSVWFDVDKKNENSSASSSSASASNSNSSSTSAVSQSLNSTSTSALSSSALSASQSSSASSSSEQSGEASSSSLEQSLDKSQTQQEQSLESTSSSSSSSLVSAAQSEQSQSSSLSTSQSQQETSSQSQSLSSQEESEKEESSNLITQKI
jgi:Peptidase family M23